MSHRPEFLRHATGPLTATGHGPGHERVGDTPLFAYFIGVSPRLVFTTLTCGPAPEPGDLTRTPGSVRFPVCLDLIARPRRSAAIRAPAIRLPITLRDGPQRGRVRARITCLCASRTEAPAP
jgi:hypothetical protein